VGRENKIKEGTMSYIATKFGVTHTATVVEDMVMCSKCGGPTVHMAPKNGSEEYYCSKCHLSYKYEDEQVEKPKGRRK
jgi:hypothetical protein